MSDTWARKFKPAIKHVLDAAPPDHREALEKALRKQSNNVATELRYVEY
jgi:hypothetical protein